MHLNIKKVFYLIEDKVVRKKEMLLLLKKNLI
jgi:hypothetical protein